MNANYEAYFAELTAYEDNVLKTNAEDRATHFALRYYRFFHHARTGKKATVDDIEKAVEVLKPWFENNPKRLVPDPQVMFGLAPMGKPSVLHNAMYGFYLSALDRDYKQVAWRK